MLHTVIFIGRSGCGKGTQARLLMEWMNQKEPDLPAGRQVLYIETGARFREFIRGTSYSSKLSNEIYEQDERQPDFLAAVMWGNMLIDEMNPDMHLVFDGAPRSHSEAVLLSTALQFYKREKPTVIFLKVSHNWSEERLLSRGRSDDRALSKIDKRLSWFEEDTWPAIEYFKTNSLYNFLEIDGEQKIEKVQADIIKGYETKV